MLGSVGCIMLLYTKYLLIQKKGNALEFSDAQSPNDWGKHSYLETISKTSL